MRTDRVSSIALIACTTTLWGCGTPHYWTKPNATIEQFRTDNYACVKEATGYRESRAPFVGYRSGLGINADLHRVCMQARGYEGPTRTGDNGQRWHDGR
jgi:hypothetical protein